MILVLLTIVDAGTVIQTYRNGSNFAYVYNAQPHQPVPLLFQHPMYISKSLFPQINYPYAIQPNPTDYPDAAVYSPFLYQLLLNNDELFRMGDENESKWFNSNPQNTAHSLPTSVTSASASVSTFNSGLNGVPSFSSASDAVFQYPLLTIFHRLFNRPSLFSNRPNRPVAISSGPPLMRPVLNNINDSIIMESLNLLNPFAQPRP